MSNSLPVFVRRFVGAAALTVGLCAVSITNAATPAIKSSTAPPALQVSTPHEIIVSALDHKTVAIDLRIDKCFDIPAGTAFPLAPPGVDLNANGTAAVTTQQQFASSTTGREMANGPNGADVVKTSPNTTFVGANLRHGLDEPKGLESA